MALRCVSHTLFANGLVDVSRVSGQPLLPVHILCHPLVLSLGLLSLQLLNAGFEFWVARRKLWLWQHLHRNLTKLFLAKNLPLKMHIGYHCP